jgi:hypothetical protein
VKWDEHAARIRRREMHIWFSRESQKERDHYEGLDIRRWEDNIKMDLRQTEWGDEIQDKDQWRAIVNTVMNLRIP